MKNKLNRGESILAIGFFVGVFFFLLTMYFNNGYLSLGILAASIIVLIGQVLAFKDFFKAELTHTIENTQHMKRLTLKEQWEFIKPLWRILLATMIIQIIGGIVGIYQNFYGALLINFWFGGVVSTMPGFIVGLIWQYVNSPKLIYQNLLIIALFGVMSVILTILAFVMPLEQISSHLKNLEPPSINSH